MLAMVVSATGLCARNLWKMVFTLSRLWELSRGPISIGDLRPPCDCAHSNRFETKRRMLIVRSAMRRLPSFRNYSSPYPFDQRFQQEALKLAGSGCPAFRSLQLGTGP